MAGNVQEPPSDTELADTYRRFKSAAERAFGPPAAPGTRAPHERMMQAANADLDRRLRQLARTDSSGPAQFFPRMDTWAMMVLQHVWVAARQPERTRAEATWLRWLFLFGRILWCRRSGILSVMHPIPARFLDLNRRLDARDWPDPSPRHNGEALLQPWPSTGPSPIATCQQILEGAAAAHAADAGEAGVTLRPGVHKAYLCAALVAFEDAKRTRKEREAPAGSEQHAVR